MQYAVPNPCVCVQGMVRRINSALMHACCVADNVKYCCSLTAVQLQ